MSYFYIKDNEIIGCGEARMLNEDIINIEVTDDMISYDDEPTWESERFKWKYKWDGEKVVDNPDFEEQEKIHYNEAMRQARSEAYAGETDALVARKIRKQTINDWTEEDEAEFIAEMTRLSDEIKERFPYKE